MGNRITVAKQVAGYVVLGTSEIREAANHLPPEVVGWMSSHPGLYVKRQGLWSFRTEVQPPKDARPGVQFVGVRTSADSGGPK